MNRKYLDYTIEDLLDDTEFTDYVLHGHKRGEWDTLFAQSPVLKHNALKARKIIEILKDGHEEISRDDVSNIWKNIDRYDTMIARTFKRRFIYSAARYAAILLLVVSAGAAIWYFYSAPEKQSGYHFSESLQAPADGEARLILHSGEEILLEKEHSKVEVSASGEIVINQEKIIQAGQSGHGKSETMNEVVVPYGKKSQLQLADGTRVWLNAGSRLAFPSEFSGNQRDVYVEGEAYFEVAHSAAQPFSVQVRDITIKVLGTRFNLSAYPGDASVETVLLEGRVSLTENAKGTLSRKSTILQPNQKATFSKESRQFRVDPVPDTDLYTAWISGWFYFSQESLINVLRKLERYYNVKFECESDFSGSGLISGKLDLKESLEQVTFALADVTGFEFRIVQDERVLVNKPLTKLPVRK